jgi:hypothetical protein
MAQRANAVAIKANFGGNDGDGGGLALRAVHGYTSEIKASGQLQRSKRGSEMTLIFFEPRFKNYCAKMTRKTGNSRTLVI